jgi:regulator of protease activity HflC (stomatin/prohibitin superfamily)
MEIQTRTLSPLRVLQILLVLGLIGIAKNSFQVVEGGHRGVRITLGEIDEKPLGEGLHFKIPFITIIHETTVRVEKTDVQTQAASKDLQNLKVQAVVSWQISPASVAKIYRKFGDEYQLVSRLILPEALSSIKAASTQRSAENLLQQRQAFEEAILKDLSMRLIKEGVILAGVNISNFDFSAEFNQAIENKQVAQQQAQQAYYLAERAKNEAQALREKAKGEADAEIERARGTAEAQTMLAKTLTAQILHQQWIAKWNGNLPTTIAGNDTNLLLSLPKKDGQ